MNEYTLSQFINVCMKLMTSLNEFLFVYFIYYSSLSFCGLIYYNPYLNPRRHSNNTPEPLN